VAVVAFIVVVAFGVSAVVNLGSGAPGAAPTAPRTYSKADADACTAADLRFLTWDDNIGQTAPLYYNTGNTLGDPTVARQQALAASSTYATIAAGIKVDAEAQQLAAVRSALANGEAAFAKPMTPDEFNAAYGQIVDAFKAFSDQCNVITYWVQQNVPQ
jgi:hypothetical protein